MLTAMNLIPPPIIFGDELLLVVADKNGLFLNHHRPGHLRWKLVLLQKIGKSLKFTFSTTTSNAQKIS